MPSPYHVRVMNQFVWAFYGLQLPGVRRRCFTLADGCLIFLYSTLCHNTLYLGIFTCYLVVLVFVHTNTGRRWATGDVAGLFYVVGLMKLYQLIYRACCGTTAVVGAGCWCVCFCHTNISKETECHHFLQVDKKSNNIEWTFFSDRVKHYIKFSVWVFLLSLRPHYCSV